MTAHIPPREREGSEPSELPRGVPWVVATLVMAIALWGAWRMVTQVPAGLAPHGDRRTLAALRPSQPAATSTGEAGEDGAIDGAAVYAARCAACHQTTGAGLAGAFPPLAGSEWVLGVPERPIAIVINGLSGKIEVKGATFESAMPRLGDQVSDAEIAAVLTYVRSSFGNEAGTVSETQVAAIRAATVNHDGPIGGQAELVEFIP